MKPRVQRRTARAGYSVRHRPYRTAVAWAAARPPTPPRVNAAIERARPRARTNLPRPAPRPRADLRPVCTLAGAGRHAGAARARSSSKRGAAGGERSEPNGAGYASGASRTARAYASGASRGLRKRTKRAGVCASGASASLPCGDRLSPLSRSNGVLLMCIISVNCRCRVSHTRYLLPGCLDGTNRQTSERKTSRTDFPASIARGPLV